MHISLGKNVCWQNAVKRRKLMLYDNYNIVCVHRNCLDLSKNVIEFIMWLKRGLLMAERTNPHSVVRAVDEHIENE